MASSLNSTSSSSLAWKQEQEIKWSSYVMLSSLSKTGSPVRNTEVIGYNIQPVINIPDWKVWNNHFIPDSLTIFFSPSSCYKIHQNNLYFYLILWSCSSKRICNLLCCLNSAFFPYLFLSLFLHNDLSLLLAWKLKTLSTIVLMQ